MEPLSATGSMLAILDTTVLVSKATTDLYHSLKDAPAELAHYSQRILQTQSTLKIQIQLYETLTDKSLDLILPTETLKALKSNLDQVEENVDIGRTLVNEPEAHDLNVTQRLGWVLCRKRKAKKVLENLRSIDSNLSALLITLAVAVSIRSNELIRGANANQQRTNDLLQARHQNLHGIMMCRCHGTPSTRGTQTLDQQYAPSTPNWSLGPRKAGNMPWNEAARPLLHSRVRSSFTSKRRKAELQSVYWFVGLMRLPHFLSEHAICMTAQLWISCFSWPRITYTMALKNIVSCDSDFITACATGDLKAARQIALAGHGTPSSIDDFGKPALHSPLQKACLNGLPDIARVLLAKGAFLEHEDLGRRSAFTMLWCHGSPSFSRVEFLKILLAYSPMASILDPPDGFGPLTCVALRGTTEELEILLNNGAYQEENDSVGDRIIRHSVIGCNIATYDMLLPLMPLEWISEADCRGKGPLHLALEYPNAHTAGRVWRLILAGADVHQKDADGCEPGDVARICDQRAATVDSQLPGLPGNFRAYFETLRSMGIDVELDDEGDLWWPSKE
ncbi:MAG: hypothetical protein Q9183_004269, partial [Haloplaca sp. 2 TL-2023]